MKHNYFKNITALICLFFISVHLNAVTNYVTKRPNNNTTQITSIYYGALSDYVHFIERELVKTEYSINTNSKSLTTALILADTSGDYRSVQDGNWTTLSTWEYYNGSAWVAATSYPGELAGTNIVTIDAANTITVGLNLTTESMGDVIVNGTLILDPPGTPNTITLSTLSLNINGGTLSFLGTKVRLDLPDAASVITIDNGGSLTAGTCNNNNEIYIGSSKYAACSGSGGTVYTFGEVVASGGNVNAMITVPPSDPIDVSSCDPINLTGGYTGTGTETNVTFEWTLLDSDGNIATITTLTPTPPSNTLADENETTTATFTPTIEGEYLVSLEITTTAGATNVETRTFNVSDTDAPIWDTVAGDLNRTVDCDDTTALTNAQSLVPVASDNCDTSLTPVKTSGAFVEGSCPQAGTFTNTWVVTDDAGNTSATYYTQTITVVDTTDPTWDVAPSDMAVQCDGTADPSGAFAAWLTSFSGSDSCGNATVTNNSAGLSDLCGATGSETVTFTLTDECGNDITAQATFTIEDTTDPTWDVAPSDMTVQCDGTADPSGAFAAWLTSFSGSDSCGNATVTNNSAGLSDLCGATGSETVTFTLTDECGNDITAQATFTIEDTTDPTWDVAPSDMTVQCDGTADPSGAFAAWLTSFSGSDSCGNATVTHNSAGLSDLCGATGSETVTFTLTDECGNDITAQATFTIEDTTDPTWDVAPSDMTVQCDGTADPSGAFAAWLTSFSGSDSCGNATVTNNSAGLSDLCGATGSETVTFTLTDECGNDITAQATFTIEDTTDPTWDVAPSDMTVQCDGTADPSGAFAAWLTSFSGSDSCGNATVTNNSAGLSDLCGATGSETVTFTLTDECGNDISAQATFTIEDTTDPTWDVAPSDMTVQCDGTADPSGAFAAWLTSFSGSDSCGNATVTNNSAGLSDLCGATGSETVTFTLTDECGNDITAQATFTIEDTTDPTWDVAPSDMTVQCDGTADPSGAFAAWLTSFSGSDSCGNATVTNNSAGLSDLCGATGSETVTFTLTDECGNDISAQATFTIEDTTDPTWDVAPSDMTVQCDGTADPSGAFAAWLTSFSGSDSCGNATVTNNSAGLSDLCGATGSETVTFTLTDECGNDITAQATFTIEDTTDPTWDVAPSDMTVQCDGTADPSGAFAAWLTSFSGSDSCGNATVTNNSAGLSDLCGATGSETVTFTLTDECGNDISAQATFTIEDTTDPTWDVAPSDMTVQCDGTADPSGAFAAWLTSFSGSDSCGNATVTNNSAGLSDLCGATGSETVTFTLTDECGNDITAQATFTIEDTTDPTWDVAPSDMTVQCDGTADPSGAFAAWLTSFSGSDSCGNATVTHNSAGLSDLCGATGSETVTFTLTDECGNDITAQATFTIEDTTDPTWDVAPSDMTVQCDGTADPSGAFAAWLTSFSGSDSCGNATVTNNSAGLSDLCGATGSETVTFTLTDECGNDITAQATFTIEDTTDPTWDVAPSDMTVQCDGTADPSGAFAAWLTSFSGSDSCGNATVTNNSAGLSDLCGATGSETVTFTLTDECGNDITAQATFTIEDTTDPTWDVAPSDMTVQCDGTADPSGAFAAWLTSFSGSDSCGNATVTNNSAGLSDLCGATGSETVTFTLTDECGNDITAQATFTIEDTTDPTWDVAPSDMTVQCDGTADPSGAFAAWLTSFSGSDSCGNATVTNNSAGLSDLCGATGSETVTFTLTDECGNDITAQATFTIEDTTDPTWDVAPSDMTVQCDGTADPSGAFAAWLTSFSGSDSCGNATVTHNSAGLSDLCGATGSETVTFTLTDECGNDITAQATFTIEDTTDPTWDVAPSDMTVQCDGTADPSGAFAAWLTSFSGSDSCGNATVTHNSAGLSDLCGATGSETVTFTLTDECGNDISAQATFTIEDTTDPTWDVAPSDMTVQCDGTADPSGAFAAWLTSFSGSDSCGNATVTNNSAGLSDLCGATGSETVTFTLTDECGNDITAQATFTIEDTTDPTWDVAPSDMTVQCDGTADPSGAFAAWLTSFSGSDSCGNATVTNNSAGLSDLCGATGSETVTFTLTDECGNDITAQATFTIEDTTDPTWDVAPSDMTVQCDGTADPSGAFAAWLTSFSGSDSCGNATVTNNSAGLSDLCGATGSETVTFTLTDECGNDITAQATFTIEDTTDPTWDVAPSDMTVQCDGTADPSGAFAAWLTSFSGSDSCGNATVTNNSAGLSDLCGATGSETVTFTLTDECGNDISAQATFTIEDTTDPTWDVAPSDMTVQCDGTADPSGAFAAWLTSFSGSDSCGNATVTNNSAGLSDLCGATGSETVTFTLTDECGNDITAQATFTIEDTTDPTWDVAPSDMTVQCDGTADPSGAFAAWLTSFSGSDSCGNATVTNNSAGLSDLCGATGSETVTFTLTDECGNDISAQATFTIEDTTDPTWDVAPSDMTVQCDGTADPSGAFAAWLTSFSGSDSCGNATVTNNSAGLSDLCGATGSETVTFTLTDECGNDISAQATFTIEDTTDPTWDVAPSDMTVQCDGTADPSGAFAAWLTSFSGSDSCGNATVTNNSAGLSDLCGATGSETVTFTLTDECGNDISAQATFTIEDTTDPTWDVAPSDMTVQCDGTADPSGAFAAWLTSFSGSDSCGNATVTNNSAGLSDLCGATGSETVTFTLTDECGNDISAQATFTIEDTTDPTWDVAPSDMTVQCDGTADPSGAFAAWLTSFSGSDSCGNATVTNNSAGLSDLCGATGSETVTFTLTDECGNDISAQATFTIEDTTDPTWDVAPSDMTVQCDGTADPSGAFAAWLTSFSGSDSCGNATVTHNSAGLSDLCGATGSETVTFTLTDECGNDISAQATFTIEDTTPPTVSAPTATALQCAEDIPAAVTTITAFNALTGASASDNCTAITNLTVTSTTGNVAGQSYNGTITRTYTITDDCGNETDVDHVFNINDTTSPTAVCQPITVQLVNGMANIDVLDIENGSSDNCGVPTPVNVSPSSFDCNDVGDNTVTLTVQDANGNIDTCTTTVKVEDNETPNTICIAPSTLTVTLDPVTGTVSLTPDQINNGSNDACGIASISVSPNSFDCNNVGINTVTLTATDVNGNSSSCSTTINVDPPTISTGAITGEVVNPTPENPVPPSDLIEVTACPGGSLVSRDVQLTLDLSGSNINASNISIWQISSDQGTTWQDVAGTSGQTTVTVTGLTSTTIVRAYILSGNCPSISPYALIRFLPPDEPPVIESVTNTNICLGTGVDIVASSFFEYGGQFGGGGYFNYANPEDWLVDGEESLPAPGNNSNPANWFETNGPKIFGGIRYDTTDNTKFAVANGIGFRTEMETPIFSTIGMSDSEAILEFYQAFYFCDGAFGEIRLSLDGGANYDIVLNTDQNDDLTSGKNSGFSVLATSGGCGSGPQGQQPTSDPFQPASIDLSDYLNEPSLRIKFIFDSTASTSTCNNAYFPDGATNTCGNIPNNFDVHSTWVVDDVGFPYAPIDEILEWTDENGDVIEIGNDVTVTPETPGIREFGVTALVNDCRADTDEGTEFVSIYTSLAYAGADHLITSGKCGESTIQLHAYDNTVSAVTNYNNGAWEASPGTGNYKVPDVSAGETDYPGTGVTGTWSVQSAPSSACGSSATFSSNTDPNATFTGESGTYVLRWTLNDANACYDEVTVEINNCNNIDFDGIDDYVTFKNNYNLNSPFSIEAWLKPEDVNGSQVIFSRKDANVNTSGYSLSLNGSTPTFSWYNAGDSGSLPSSNTINNNRWYHIAVTFDGSEYNIYVDGVLSGTIPGSAPDLTPNNIEAILGAMDQNPPGDPVDYYHGWVDEFRIWNKSLDVQHIRQMMNQEIKEFGGNVQGEVIPTKIYGPDTDQDGTEENLLTWANLEGYYRMAVDCGYLTAYKGVTGRLRNIFTNQTENAPIPYTTKQNGNWNNSNTWTHGNVWHIPNSTEHGTTIDWNIARTSHNLVSESEDITLLGLLVESNELTITSPGTQDENTPGTGLWVTHYLKLDGQIDLVGESQLVQKRYNSSGNPTVQFNESILDVNSSGYIERDQQGTNNPYNYNYWGLPVGPQVTGTNNNPRNINSVMRDGTNSSAPLNIQWTSAKTPPSTSPITLSTRWLYSYENHTTNTYAAWRRLGNSSTFAAGLGYTMKGSGKNYIPYTLGTQNYVFIGKPNNGTITTPLNPGYDALIGNPYPSAIDANQFLIDNAGTITGALYFWEHYPGNNTHVLRDYLGGYAVLNFIGGIAATTPPPTAEGYVIIGGEGTKIPERYIPVGQGFFVSATSTAYGTGVGGQIVFNNNQRVFQREAVSSDNSGSVFFKSSNPKAKNDKKQTDAIKRLRINFKTPEGAMRQLLLGFVSNGSAGDGIDYGYDAPKYNTLPNDLVWRIDNKSFEIQGLGTFDENKQCELGLFLSKNGTIEISLASLENFDPNTKVYVYDALLGTYTRINNLSFSIDLDSGDYTNRFYIAFKKEHALSIDDDAAINQVSVNYLHNNHIINIKTPNRLNVKQVYLINVLGQTVKSWEATNIALDSNNINIPVFNISEGNYIVKIITSEGTTSKKIIINQ
ncbi:T9SS type A sorting domain-containing protein [Flavobacteriaceae bacterium GSB9]|nr:T9SS type A sorting domain-containing protein [Flavobacteriaceae bacterium GSB9]